MTKTAVALVTVLAALGCAAAEVRLEYSGPRNVLCLDGREVENSPWRIVEGAYSLHPRFGDYADLKVFFDIAPEEQMRRIRRRNGEARAAVFAKRWIPLEEKYLSAFDIRDKADLVVDR